MNPVDSQIIPFDPGSPELPRGLFTPAADGGEVVVLLAEEGVRRSGWAGRATCTLAAAWSGTGGRVFLADGDVVEGGLNTLLGGEDGEGLSDAVTFGSSPARIARPIPEHGFLFAPAGTVVADPEGYFRNPRWPRLLRAFRESGATLVLYLPAEVPGVEALVSEGDRVIRLRGEGGVREPGEYVLHPVDAGTAPTELDTAGVTMEEEAEFVLPPDPVPEPREEEPFDFRLDHDEDSEDHLANLTSPHFGGELVFDDKPGAEDVDDGEVLEWDLDVPTDALEADILEEEGSIEAPELPAAWDEGDLPEVLSQETPEEPQVPEEPEVSEVPEERSVFAPDPDHSRISDGDAEAPAMADSPPTPAAPVEAVAEAPDISVSGTPDITVAAAQKGSTKAKPRAVKRSVSPLLLVLLLLVVVGVLAAAWLGYIEIPGLPLPAGGLGLGGGVPTVPA